MLHIRSEPEPLLQLAWQEQPARGQADRMRQPVALEHGTHLARRVKAEASLSFKPLSHIPADTSARLAPQNQVSSLAMAQSTHIHLVTLFHKGTTYRRQHA